MTLVGIRNALLASAEAAGVTCAVHTLDAVGSTNTWLSERPAPAAGAAEAVLALHQTAGRGRAGRRWQAPRGSGLCFSVSWTFERMPEHASALTLALGVAAARALESLGLGEAMLKWPNDLVWQDRKLGGILVESSVAPNGVFRVIAGVGINLQLPESFSLDDSGGGWSRGIVDLASAQVETTLADLGAAVLGAWLPCLAAFEHTPLTETVAAFNRRNWLHDRACELEGEMMRCGDVDAEGRLLVVGMTDGYERALESGEIVPLAWSAAS
ncbi:MAG: biotin--[acetyl-CoA-carboxylase] ligase [Pseudomonadota bacterium]